MACPSRGFGVAMSIFVRPALARVAGPRGSGRAWWLCAAWAGLLGVASTCASLAEAQGAPAPTEPSGTGPIDAFAQAFVEARYARSGGDVAEWPEAKARPATAETTRTELAWAEDVAGMVRVHTDAPWTGEPTLTEAALYLGRARAEALSLGWGAPGPDGGRGGSSAWDVYVRAERAGETGSETPSAWAETDGIDLAAHHDTAIAYGRVAWPRAARGTTPLRRLLLRAYAASLVLARDPGEAPCIRAGLAGYLADRLATALGEPPSPVAPSTGAEATDDDEHAQPRLWCSPSLWHAVARLRGDDFVRDVSDFAQQRTPAGMAPRGEPDVLRALLKAMELGGTDRAAFAEALAGARLEGPRGWMPPQATSADAPLPTLARITWASLPHHTAPASPALGPLESALAVVDVRAPAGPKRLRVWCDGEYGVKWSLLALRYDQDGRELGRVSAPRRDKERRVYLVLEVPAETAEVHLLATNLGHAVPDADVPTVERRSVKFILDRAE